MPPALLLPAALALIALLTTSAVAFASAGPGGQESAQQGEVRPQSGLPMRAMVSQLSRDVTLEDDPAPTVPVNPAGPPAPEPTATPTPPATGGPSTNIVYTEADMDLLLEIVGWPVESREAAKAVAWCESNWRTDATGIYGTVGLFQIHPVHGALASYDPVTNAQAALVLSSGGTDWSPWSGCAP